MVGKSYLVFILMITVVLAAQPHYEYNPFFTTSRASEGYDYDIDNLPPKDENGNFTIFEEEHWQITGDGILLGNITLFDQSKLTIIDANITLNGTIWAKDESEIIIKSSLVRVEVPSHPPILVEEQYDNPNGFLLTDDGTLFTIEDSDLYLARHDIDQTMPPGMMVPAEVLVNFGKLEIKDTYINTLGSMTVGTVKVDIYRGLVMHMTSDTYLKNATLTTGIVFYVSSHGFIENSTLEGLTIEKNVEEYVVISNCTVTRSVTVAMVSNARFRNCIFESCLIVDHWGTASLYNTTLTGIKVHDNGTAILDASSLPIDPPRPEWRDLKDNSSLIMMNSSFIKDVILYDNSSLYMSNSLINSTTMCDYTSAILEDSSFVEIMYLYDNSTLYMRNSLMNSTIMNNHTSATVKDSTIKNLSANEDTTIQFQSSTLSEYSSSAKIHNITTLLVTTTLNNQPLQLSVEIKDTSNETLVLLETNEKGVGEFNFVRGTTTFDKNAQKTTYTPLITNCYAIADYDNLHKEEGVVIDAEYEEIRLEFEDYNAPTIGRVNYEIDPFFNTNDNVQVSVNVEEDETNWINVTLRYSIDNGDTWEEIPMYNLGQNKFKNSIPGQDDGTKVRFYIVAEDSCGNVAESNYYAYTVGEDLVYINKMILTTILIIVLCFILWAGIKVIMRKSKVRKYLRKTEK